MSASVRMPTANGTSNGNFPHASEDAPISEAPLMQEITTPEFDSSVQQTAPDSKKRVVFRYYAPAEDEARLRWLCEQYPLYSMCPQEKYYVLWEFLELKRSQIAMIQTAFSELEGKGYNLYESAMVAKIISVTGFSVKEALEIYRHIPETPLRALELYKLQQYLSELNNEADIIQTKILFSKNYPVQNIRAALTLGKKLNVAPEEIITYDKDVEGNIISLSESEQK